MTVRTGPVSLALLALLALLAGATCADSPLLFAVPHRHRRALQARSATCTCRRCVVEFGIPLEHCQALGLSCSCYTCLCAACVYQLNHSVSVCASALGLNCSCVHPVTPLRPLPPPPPPPPPPPLLRPVDCVQSWSPCTSACEKAAFRVPVLTTAPRNGGAPCGP
jgi:hypothetical protein